MSRGFPLRLQSRFGGYGGFAIEIENAGSSPGPNDREQAEIADHEGSILSLGTAALDPVPGSSLYENQTTAQNVSHYTTKPVSILKLIY